MRGFRELTKSSFQKTAHEKESLLHMILFRKKNLSLHTPLAWSRNLVLYGGYCRQYSPGTCHRCGIFAGTNRKILWNLVPKNNTSSPPPNGLINTEQMLFPVHWVIPTARYFTSDMDGRKVWSRVPLIWLQKGILVVNAAGNEGQTRWHTIDTPADAGWCNYGGWHKSGIRHAHLFQLLWSNSAGVLKPECLCCWQSSDRRRTKSKLLLVHLFYATCCRFCCLCMAITPNME